MKLNIFSILIAVTIISISACVKEKENIIPDNGHTHTDDTTHTHGDDTTAVAKSGSFELHFNNMVGDKTLEMGSTWYTTEMGDSFTVTTFNYYISNIVLHKMGGGTYAEKESYHIIKQGSTSSQVFTLSDIPAGHYTGISFTIGVDAARNTSGAQTGALDPIHGMFWSWNTGYIMAKFEGLAPKSPNGSLKWHIGGFEGDNNVIKTVDLNFGEHKAIDGNTMHIHLMADVKKWFHGEHHIDLSTTNMIHMPGAKAKMIADNYAKMFSLKH